MSTKFLAIKFVLFFLFWVMNAFFSYSRLKKDNFLTQGPFL